MYFDDAAHMSETRKDPPRSSVLALIWLAQGFALLDWLRKRLNGSLNPSKFGSISSFEMFQPVLPWPVTFGFLD